MDKLIAAFPSNMIEALSIASKAQISKNTHEIRNILITGMGGSGIGGKIVALWLQDEHGRAARLRARRQDPQLGAQQWRRDHAVP